MNTLKNSFSVIFVILLLAGFVANSCSNNSSTDSDDQSALPDRLLLKDYRPESIYNIHETEIKTARFPVIDMHAHDYAKTREGLDAWVETLDKAGISKTMIISHTHGSEFDSLAGLYSAYPDRFNTWCGIDYTQYNEQDFAEKAIAELVRCHEKGAMGVGELGDKGRGLYYSKPAAEGMHPDDPNMDPIWEKCGELDMPVNLHIADPKWMYLEMDSTNDGMMNAYKWRLDNKEGIKSHEEMIEILERTLAKHPGTTFIAYHLANCSYDLDKAAELLDSYPNLYLDISARYAEFCATPRRTRAFMINNQDRLLYGTDMGRSGEMYRTTFRLLESADEHIYSDIFSYHWPLHALDLPGEVLEKIYRLNALTVAGR